jgi:hypothetical protein
MQRILAARNGSFGRQRNDMVTADQRVTTVAATEMIRIPLFAAGRILHPERERGCFNSIQIQLGPQLSESSTLGLGRPAPTCTCDNLI